MLDESLVVTSAVSAFNNAAVVAPAFLWNAVLALPLFAAIYVFGRHALDKLGLRSYVTMERATFWTIVIMALWVILMGGNYAVLRDGVSLLPWVTAAILFFAFMFIGINTRVIKLPIWYGAANASSKHRWIINILFLILFLVPVGLSDVLNWWGPILQIGAVLCGFLFGRWGRANMAPVPWTIGIMLATTIGILMQPELFRFGQLGNLTPAHLIWVLMVGMFAAVAMAAVVVNARGRIHQSAYVKLKWLTRFISALCMILFLLTEAVPIFIASVAALFVQFAMSVWHSDTVPQHLGYNAMAITMVLFGVLTGAVAITAIGLLLIAASDSRHLGMGFML